MVPQDKRHEAEQDVGIDLTDITLDDLEELDDSALSKALRRFRRESTSESDGAVAHNSTTHNSSHSSSPW